MGVFEDVTVPDQPICVIVDRNVLPGNKQEFEELLSGIIAESSRFPGFIDTHVSRPKTAEGHRYQVLFKFDTQEHLDAWVTSRERLYWVEKIDALIEKPTHLQFITGLETWFTLAGQKTITPPPRYKMAVVSWLAITPLLIVFNLVFGPLLSELPFVLRFVCSTPFIVLIMTYVWMPFMTKLFRFWLYPRR